MPARYGGNDARLESSDDHGYPPRQAEW
jgi:hypothetical protein